MKSAVAALLAIALFSPAASAQYPPAAQFQAAIDNYASIATAIGSGKLDPLQGYINLCSSGIGGLRVAGTDGSGNWPHSTNVSEYTIYLTASRWTVYDAANKGIVDSSLPLDQQVGYQISLYCSGKQSAAQTVANVMPRLQAAVTKMRNITWD